MHSEVNFISGKSFSDHRGTLNTVNEFHFAEVKRFYQVTNNDDKVIRAWQAHKIEKKYFYVNVGTFIVAWVKVDDFENPSSNLTAEHKILSADKPGILIIPGGYANGIRAITPGSILTIYSNFTLEESEADRWQFDSSLWFNWQQQS